MVSTKKRALVALRRPIAIHGFSVPYPRKTIENQRDLAACFGGDWNNLVDRLEEQMEILLDIEVRGHVIIEGRLGTASTMDVMVFPFALVDFLARLRGSEAELISVQ